MSPVADEVCLDSVVPAEGVDRFRLAGLAGGEAVHARWDGRLLWLSSRLHERAQLMVSLDGLFADAGYPHSGRRVALHGPITDVALTLAGSCDVVDLVEYGCEGRHRAVVAVPGGSARAVEMAPVDGGRSEYSDGPVHGGARTPVPGGAPS
jgi:hypothetical protein